MDAIYLNEAEKSLFDKLPESLKEGWQTEEEKGTAYESDEVLKMRRKMASFVDFPQVIKVLVAVEKGETQGLSLVDIPEGILPELFFTIGARGLEVLIMRLLADAKTDGDLEGLAGLATCRHEILETNSSVSLV
ncbi:hypothetical protein A3A67_03485 [Candidatus Peribacteria bacterium RIFCSPLOWO2_01_FULL_51_18]|nr:MAG: hypothetical protein A3C52_05225 [Candidatus Peribacteria bacterium RIFCSPHIGHO2_02_FULL_51_15]OGJ66520.1 MAG: hypothetical protein A3A67_03485 [Candidatus Peribacteria bacterium RIFCSPLOWO2_01_FULL_51_18]OGJ67460.1 MAG: hypothetical protein A3J34_03900 [Candidatus Peribacteria bacterium RIFCSPLOWO2_02_FULL_51_10]